MAFDLYVIEEPVKTKAPEITLPTKGPEVIVGGSRTGNKPVESQTNDQDVGRVAAIVIGIIVALALIGGIVSSELTFSHVLLENIFQIC